MRRLFGLSVLAGILTSGAAHAQVTDDLIKIGVLTDISGLYADPTGQGSVFAAKLAADRRRPQGPEDRDHRR